MASKYDGLARIIIQNIGGKENIKGITHCVTRLRFTLADESKANTDILKDTDGVVTVIQSGGQYMVVIGNQVADVYDAVVSVGHLEALAAAPGASEEGGEKKHMNPFNAFVSIVTGVFTPFLGVLCACGILKGFLSLFATVGVMDGSGSTYNILYSLADSAFYFLPVVLGYTAAKRFKLPEMEGIILGCAMIYPYLLSGSEYVHSSLFYIPVVAPSTGDYTSTVLPVICTVAFAAWFERLYKRFIPDTVKLFLVPLITLIVSFCLGLWIIGPVTSIISAGIGWVFNAIMNFSPILMGLVVGFFWQILVMFGLHWALVPIALMNMTTGGDVIIVAMFGTTFAQTGACIGIWIKSHDKKIKSLAPAAIISGIAGVTEPAIYGITLPKKWPYIRTCVIAAVAGAVLCMGGVKAYAMAGMGVFGYTAYIGQNGEFGPVIFTVVVSILCVVAGVASELIFYSDKPKAKKNADAAGGQAAIEGGDKGETLAAPVNGKAVALSDIEDAAFNSGAMGQGLAIIPAEGKVYAPCDGEITVFFPTGHAIGIKSAKGAELLIHVGMDTVDMDGDGFTPKKQQGDMVKKGDLLLEFDIDKIKAAGHDIATPMVITNSDEYADVVPTDPKEIKVGDEAITLL